MARLTVPDDLATGDERSLRSDAGTLAAYRRLGGSPRFRVFVRQTTFVFVRRGVKRLHGHAECWEAPRGRFVVMLPGTHVMSETVDGGGAYESTVASFSPRFLRDLHERRPGWFPGMRRSARPGVGVFDATPHLTDVVTGLPQSVRRATTPDVVGLKLAELCLCLRDTDAAGMIAEALHRAGLAGDGKLQAVVERHRLEPLSLPQMATLAGRSLSAFKRDFQRVYGEPPGRWLRRARLEHARMVLESTDTTVTELGLESGFADVSSFIRAFRQQHGATPKQLQRASRHGPPPSRAPGEVRRGSG
ncbi:MAG: AraC family transcriptional regulator [Myxococcota bacterium]